MLWYVVTFISLGCSNAVNRVLTKLEGVKNIDISLEKQTVDVTTVNGLSYDTVLEKIKKTGKEVKGGSVVA